MDMAAFMSAKCWQSEACPGCEWAGDSVFAHLSNRELEVCRLLGRGFGTRQIARDMRISIKNVHSFRLRIKKKLKLFSSMEVLRQASRRHDKQSLK
jgi:DNA-binding NarL/FixJ family response regulator